MAPGAAATLPSPSTTCRPTWCTCWTMSSTTSGLVLIAKSWPWVDASRTIPPLPGPGGHRLSLTPCSSTAPHKTVLCAGSGKEKYMQFGRFWAGLELIFEEKYFQIFVLFFALFVNYMNVSEITWNTWKKYSDMLPFKFSFRPHTFFSFLWILVPFLFFNLWRNKHF